MKYIFSIYHLVCLHAENGIKLFCIILSVYFFMLQTYLCLNYGQCAIFFWFRSIEISGSNILQQLVSLYAENVLVVFGF